MIYAKSGAPVVHAPSHGPWLRESRLRLALQFGAKEGEWDRRWKAWFERWAPGFPLSEHGPVP